MMVAKECGQHGVCQLCVHMYVCATSTIYVNISVLFLSFMGESTTAVVVVVVEQVCVKRREREE